MIKKRTITLLLFIVIFGSMQIYAAPIIKILNSDSRKCLNPKKIPLNTPLKVQWKVKTSKKIEKQTLLISENKTFSRNKMAISDKEINSENSGIFSALVLPKKIGKWYIKLKVQVKSRTFSSGIYSIEVTEPLLNKITKMKGMYSHYGKSEPPAARWLLFNYSGQNAQSDMRASAKEKKFPIFSFYALLAAPNIQAYKKWVIEQAEAIGKYKNLCIIVLEPDRFASNTKNDPILDWAIATIKSKAPNAAVFLDIGHSRWIQPKDIVRRVKKYKSYEMIDGFASNVSNFRPDKDEAAFALKLFKTTKKPVIIDTSRNGLSTKTGKCPTTVHNPPRTQWEPGAPFAFHPKQKHILFNYHNKPYHEKD